MDHLEIVIDEMEEDLVCELGNYTSVAITDHETIVIGIHLSGIDRQASSDIDSIAAHLLKALQSWPPSTGSTGSMGSTSSPTCSSCDSTDIFHNGRCAECHDHLYDSGDRD